MVAVVPAREPAPLAAWRIWQFHNLDEAYVSASLKLASRYDINTMVWFQGMRGETAQLYREPERAAALRRLTQQAHGLGLKAWIWIHELDSVPKQFMNGKKVAIPNR